MHDLDKLALWHQISSVKYLGPVRFRTLWKKLGPEMGRVFGMGDEELLALKGVVTRQNLPFIRETAGRLEESRIFMAEQIGRARECEGQIVTLDEPCYPRMLRESKVPHPLIYCVGSVEQFAEYSESVAIVGTRGAAQESLHLAEQTAYALAAEGWVVVSGLAKGTDSRAHEGALRARGRTIAVLGNGPDVVYPAGSGTLQQEIMGSGLLLSEFPFGTPPEDWKLKKRNKTTVALAAATFVVETSLKGGTMNAVRACTEQKKPLFTVLPPWSGDFSGNAAAADAGAQVLDLRRSVAQQLLEGVTQRGDASKNGTSQERG